MEQYIKSLPLMPPSIIIGALVLKFGFKVSLIKSLVWSACIVILMFTFSFIVIPFVTRILGALTKRHSG